MPRDALLAAEAEAEAEAVAFRRLPAPAAPPTLPVLPLAVPPLRAADEDLRRRERLRVPPPPPPLDCGAVATPMSRRRIMAVTYWD